jgi:hypothetical protein
MIEDPVTSAVRVIASLMLPVSRTAEIVAVSVFVSVKDTLSLPPDPVVVMVISSVAETGMVLESVTITTVPVCDNGKKRTESLTERVSVRPASDRVADDDAQLDSDTTTVSVAVDSVTVGDADALRVRVVVWVMVVSCD